MIPLSFNFCAVTPWYAQRLISISYLMEGMQCLMFGLIILMLTLIKVQTYGR